MHSSGIVIVPKGAAAEVIAAAQTAEAAGIDFCLVADEGFNADVYAMLTTILAHTSRLRVAPITNPYTRHPAVTAAALATLNSLAPGRVFLAVVAGGSLALDPMALPAQEPAVACRELIAIVRLLLSGEKVDFAGQRYSLRGAQLQVPAAPVEIWVIGRGRQMVRMAGECADVAVVTSQFGLEATLGAMRSAAAEAGRPLRTAALNNMAFTQAVIDQMRPHYTYVLPNSPPAVQRELGLSAEWVAELKRVRETDGVEAAARLISDDLLRRNMVLGTSAECAEQLHQLARRWGFAHFIMPIMSLDSDYAGPTIREAARIFALARQLLSEGETPHAPQRQ